MANTIVSKFSGLQSYVTRSDGFAVKGEIVEVDSFGVLVEVEEVESEEKVQNTTMVYVPHASVMMINTSLSDNEEVNHDNKKLLFSK